MPDVGTANFSLVGMGGLKRTLRARMRERFVTPQDFGAVGDGNEDDTEAIQACLDYACVTGGEANAHLCRPVRFPNGQYKISAPLVVTESYGVALFGAGSRQVRIFWDPEAEPVLRTSVWLFDAYPLVEFMTCNHTRIEGITFDCNSVQGIALHFTPISVGAGYGDGTDGIYRDVHVTNATDEDGRLGRGVYFSGHAMGSERTWIKCKFTNCAGAGYVVLGGNTINHFFYGCIFKDNAYGLYQGGPGSSFTFTGCDGSGNSVIDYSVIEGMVSVLGCHSTSTNFVGVSGYIAGNVHDSDTEGWFIVNADGFGGSTNQNSNGGRQSFCERHRQKQRGDQQLPAAAGTGPAEGGALLCGQCL